MEQTEILRKDVPRYGIDPAWLVRRNGQLFIISTAQMDEFEPETQAFRVSEPAMEITDWDDVAGGRGATKEQVLAELTQRPVDEHGYVLSRRDVLERAEAEAEAAKRQPVDPELFRRTAPQWNCVDFPDGPHYTPSGGSCSWCGMTREQIHAQWDEREISEHTSPPEPGTPGHEPVVASQPAGTVQVKRDGMVQATFAGPDPVQNSNDAFAWLLAHQGQSVDWAIRYEGWEITDPAHDGPCGNCGCSS